MVRESGGCLAVCHLSDASRRHLLQQSMKAWLAKTVSSQVTISLSGLFFVDYG